MSGGEASYGEAGATVEWRTSRSSAVSPRTSMGLDATDPFDDTSGGVNASVGSMP